MTRSVGSLFVVLALVAGCGSDSGAASGCVEPPAEELVASTDVVLTVDPDPVIAGSDAELTATAGESVSGQVVVGAAVVWQCWDGTAWIDTHHVLRGHYGDYRVQAFESDVTVTMPAVGILVPNTFSIQIPDVPAGTYRISEMAVLDGGETTTATVTVRVE